MGIGKQLKVAGSCFWSLVTHPFTLVYPVLTAVSVMGTLLGLGFLALSIGTPVGLDLPSSMVLWILFFAVALPLLFLGLPLIITTLKVAYCYEIHELYRGRRPMPGAGLAVALRSPKRIVLGTVIIAGLFNAGRVGAGDMDSIGNAGGAAAVAGSHVLTTFMAPAIAIEDASARATAQYVREAVGKRWAEGFAGSYGVSFLCGQLFVVGLVAMFVLFGAIALGVLPFNFQMAGLAVLCPVLGFFGAVSVKALVDGPISTALYIYAIDGEEPSRLGLSVEQIANIG